MKKLSIILALILCLGLAACGEKTPDMLRDYSAIIGSVQSEDDKTAFPIISDKTSDEGEGLLAMLGLDASDIDEFSAAASFINVNAYCIGIFMPAQGRQDAVKAALETYIDLTGKSMDGYLPEQYEIAKRAKVKALKSGEIFIVMCENDSTVQKTITDAFK